MNQEVLLWLLGILNGLFIPSGSALVWYCWTMNTRVTALEVFIKTFIKGAAEILHNDDTPELDKLLEKLRQSYHDNHYDLTIEEWRELERLSAMVRDDMTREPGKRLS